MKITSATITATLMLAASIAVAEQAPDAATPGHVEQCKAYSRMEDIKPVEREIWFQACLSELKRLDNSQTNATDYAYNH